MSDRALEGRRILLIEDEYLVATDLVTALENAGAVVFGPVSDLERAMDIVGSRFALDGAVLDINLDGEMVYPAAAVLSEHSVPIVFVTGYECRSLPEPFARNPCLAKPFNERDLIDALTTIVRTAA
ncbi:response regulator [Rhizobium wenxiniae]|uniref:response regulator n=1 Tax=Rhizobium wenxiniae TaxID=1737357 RepID=UPI001C6E4A95|nr:response regulator [Rhizobium wenxiniae]MBW9091941.1 response regulator [Rhizobium wenxiniae]